MSPISEAELTELVADNPAAITKLEIIETEDGTGRWYLRVFFKGQKASMKLKSPAVLTSVRRSVRSWADLNNMLSWVRKLCTPKTEIQVIMNYHDPD